MTFLHNVESFFFIHFWFLINQYLELWAIYGSWTEQIKKYPSNY